MDKYLWMNNWISGFVSRRQFTRKEVSCLGKNFWKIKRKPLKIFFFLNNFYVPNREYLCVLLCSNYADIYGKCVITFIRICIEYKVSFVTFQSSILKYFHYKRFAAFQNTIGYYALLLLLTWVKRFFWLELYSSKAVENEDFIIRRSSF